MLGQEIVLLNLSSLFKFVAVKDVYCFSNHQCIQIPGIHTGQKLTGGYFVSILHEIHTRWTLTGWISWIHIQIPLCHTGWTLTGWILCIQIPLCHTGWTLTGWILCIQIPLCHTGCLQQRYSAHERILYSGPLLLMSAKSLLAGVRLAGKSEKEINKFDINTLDI